MIEIYIRNENDPNYRSGIVESIDELDIFLSQIEMVLATNKTEVLGEPKFGASLEEYIHSFSFNETQLKREVENQIEYYCTLAEKFTYIVEVTFVKGSQRDIGIIDILIDNKKVFGIVVT